MKFQKWQALGNDYLIIEERDLPFPLDERRVQRLCHPHFGVGADGVLLLSPPSDPKHVARLRIFNPDGSEAELSGNGAREAIMYLRRAGWTERDSFVLETAAGEIRPQILSDRRCRVDMGVASLQSTAYPSGTPDGRGILQADRRRWNFRHVSIGNPQCAIRMDTVAAVEELVLSEIGAGIEGHPLFPRRTNVSWFAETAPGAIRARIYERGVGETLSSGTGASGAAIAYVEDGGSSPVTVTLDGGELTVEVAQDLRIHLTGWAVPVCSGTVSDDLIKELS